MKFEIKPVPKTVLLDAILNIGIYVVVVRFNKPEIESKWKEGFGDYIKFIKQKMFKAIIEKQMGWTSPGYKFFCKRLEYL